MKITGVVTQVTEFGVFIALDDEVKGPKGVKVVSGLKGITGMCHRSEAAEKGLKDASKVYSVNDLVKAVVLSIDEDQQRLSLGLKVHLHPLHAPPSCSPLTVLVRAGMAAVLLHSCRLLR